MDPTVISKSALDIDAIPGYRIEKYLAGGGMGGVFLALDENLKRPVAIKVIHPEFKNDPEYRERFIREARTVAGFQHPNIVTIYASDCGERLYMVMEYVAGGTLAQRNETRPTTPQEALEIGVLMADALAYAHERNVIHRDFKPGNILLKANGTPMLSDFGIAKSELLTGVETKTGIVIGNMRYMAPEQAQGLPISNRVDVYSFGLVLHELLTERLPDRHPVRDKRDGKDIERAIGSGLGALVSRCLAVDPSARPSAAECRDLLQAHRDKPGRMATNRQWLWTSAAVAAGMVAAIAGGLLWRSAGERPLRASASPAARVAADPSTAGQRGAASSLILQKSPASATIYIDGQAVSTATPAVAAGNHEIAAVAAGYYGEIRKVHVDPEGPALPVNFVLQPTSLPSAAEVERFSALADARQLTEKDVQSMSDRTFRTVLQAKLLDVPERQGDYDRMVKDIEALQSYGDSRAAVADMLVASLRAGHIGRSQVMQPLIAASRGGDPMATFFLAVSYRESMNASGVSVSAADSRFRNYCRQLSLVASQGWDDLANESMRRDHCPSESNRPT